MFIRKNKEEVELEQRVHDYCAKCLGKTVPYFSVVLNAALYVPRQLSPISFSHGRGSDMSLKIEKNVHKSPDQG